MREGKSETHAGGVRRLCSWSFVSVVKDQGQQDTKRPAGAKQAAGFTLIEVLVTFGILGVLLAIVAPHLDASRTNILTAEKLLVGNLRLARTDAITKGVHYHVQLGATDIEFARMQEAPDGTWYVDPASVQRNTLPTGTELIGSTVGFAIEFDTRGLAQNLTGQQVLRVHDVYGNARSVQVWPSGQVNEL